MAQYVYRKISNISRPQSQNVNVSRLVLQLSLPNSLRPGVELKINMLLEQRRQAMLQLHLRDQQFDKLLRCVFYQRFDGNNFLLFLTLMRHTYLKSVDNRDTQGTKVSADMVKTKFSWNIPPSSPKALSLEVQWYITNFFLIFSKMVTDMR